MARVYLEEPRIVRELLTDPSLAWVWAPLRLWLGWQWFDGGLHKVTNPAWMETGVAIKGFWERAVVVPEGGRPAVVYDWYRAFLQLLLEGGHHPWFAKLVVLGEMAVGLGLILGALTGIAAFFGVFMNWHFVMAGAASVNAVLALVGVLLVLAWRTAGWWGLDRWLLPAIGTPRHTGTLLRGKSPQTEPEQPSGP